MAPRTLGGLRKVPAGLARIRAAQQFIADREEESKEARRIRNDEVRALIAEHGPAETARLTGIPLPTVKAIKGPA